MLLCEIEGRVLGGACSLRCWWMLLCEAFSLRCWWMLLCEIEGRVLGGMQFEVLVDAALRA